MQQSGKMEDGHERKKERKQKEEEREAEERKAEEREEGEINGGILLCAVGTPWLPTLTKGQRPRLPLSCQINVKETQRQKPRTPGSTNPHNLPPFSLFLSFSFSFAFSL